MLLVSQELTIGSQTQCMSKVLRPSKEELDWIHSLRYDQMREAPKQPLGWTGAPESALPTVQSVQRALGNNSEARMWIYNLTVRGRCKFIRQTFFRIILVLSRLRRQLVTILK